METAACETILTDNLGIIHGVCRRYLKNHDDSMEMAQEVAAKILTGRNGFRGESLASTWVFTVAKNACLEKLRKESRERRRMGSYALHLLTLSGIHAFNDPETNRGLEKMVERGDEITRKIISLYAEHGMTQEEIGGVLGVSRVAISRRLDRFRKKLAQPVACRLPPA